MFALVVGGYAANDLLEGNSAELNSSGVSQCAGHANGWTGHITGVKIPATRAVTETRVIVLINDYRKAHGLHTVTASPALAEAARYHDSDMKARNYFEHFRPGETFPARLARYSPAQCIGETMTFGTGGFGNAAGIVSLWRSSPPHRAILLTPLYRKVGVGILTGNIMGQANATLATADFSN